MALKRLSLVFIKDKMLRFYTARGAPSQMFALQPPKMSALSNGVQVASVDTNRPTVYISVVVKAGARYETPMNQGVTHCLRHCFGLSSRRFTPFGITRNLQLWGAEVEAANSRDYMIYRMTCHRRTLKDTLQYFTSAITEQMFNPWEISAVPPAMLVDAAKYISNPHVETMEIGHKFAFRTGLGNSLCSPVDLIGKHNQQMISTFVKSTFAPNRTAVGIVGLPHEMAMEGMNLLQFEGGGSIQEVPPVYGGGEVRNDRIGPYTNVMIANQSTGTKDHKQLAAYALLQHVLGTNPVSKRRCVNTRIFNAIKKATDAAIAITSVNHAYSDAGLFAFYLTGKGEDIENMIRSLLDELNAVKAGVSEADVQLAKQKVKTGTQMYLEFGPDLADELAINALQHGKAFDANYWDSLFEGVSPSDVNNAIKKVVNGNLTIAAVGNMIKMPYLDELRPQNQVQQPPNRQGQPPGPPPPQGGNFQGGLPP